METIMTNREYSTLARFLTTLRAISNLDPDAVFDFCQGRGLDPGNILHMSAAPFDWFATLPSDVREAVWDGMIMPLIPQVGAVRVHFLVDANGEVRVISAQVSAPQSGEMINLVPEVPGA